MAGRRDAMVTPIRPEIEPRYDGEREMVDYLASKVRQYADEAGAPPTAVAVVFLSDFGEFDQAYSWSPGEHRRHATCARAAVLLTKRALDK